MRWLLPRRDGALEQFAEAIRPELRELQSPAPSEGVLRRILDDRAAGVRVILPDVPASRRARPLRLALGVLAAASIPLLLVPGWRKNDATGVSLGGAYLRGLAQAQDLDARPSLPRVVVASPERIRATTLGYARTWRDSTGAVTSSFVGTLVVTPDTMAGAPVWRAVSVYRGTRDGGAEVDAETVYVSRADLRLVARRVHVAPYRRYEGINIDQRFVGDSVIGRMTLDGREHAGFFRPIARRLPVAYAPFTTDVLAPVLFAAVPLNRGWSGSVSLVGWSVVPKDVVYPVELRVVGEDTVRVPGGVFDCWTLSVRFSGGEMQYWVRKTDGVAVRALERRSAATGGAREVLLLRG